MTSRRGFLKLGLLGGALLAAGGTASWFAGRDAEENRRDVLGAAIPVVLEAALPGEADARQAAASDTLAAVELAIAGLSPAAQDELADLFALAAVAPSRWLLTGLAGPWRSASADEVAAVLQRWRYHRLALLRSAYLALHDLIVGTWYANERSWKDIVYPGPVPWHVANDAGGARR